MGEHLPPERTSKGIPRRRFSLLDATECNQIEQVSPRQANGDKLDCLPRKTCYPIPRSQGGDRATARRSNL